MNLLTIGALCRVGSSRQATSCAALVRRLCGTSRQCREEARTSSASSSASSTETDGKDIAEVKQGQGGGQLQTSFAKKAKENVKTAGYGSVILAGIAITATLVYFVGRELFSGESPNRLFQKASEECVAHPKVQNLLGMPIKAFGEETRRGRRRHVSFLEYQDESGKRGMRVKFYLQGSRRRATAQLDAREDASGKLTTRFLIVTTDDMLRTTVVVQDNR